MPANPQRTSATFGDWELRCQRDADAQTCEAVQTVSTPQGQPVVQLVVAVTANPARTRLAMVVPPSATLTTAPRLLGFVGAAPEAPVLDLAWLRCLPEACVADALLQDDILRRLRTGTGTYRLVLLDGTGRERSLPVSPRGLAQALDAFPAQAKHP